MAERLEYDDMDANIRDTLQALGVLPLPDDEQMRDVEPLPGQTAVPSLDIQQLQEPIWHDTRRVLAERWRRDTRVHTLLEAMLGPYGSEFSIQVLEPLVDASLLGRSATQACCVVLFHKRRMEVVMCDNAAPYPNMEAIEDFWTNDYLDVQQKNQDTLDVRQKPELSPYVVTASIILPQVCAVYDGTLSVLSEGQRVDFTCQSGVWNIRDAKIPRLAANAVLANLPYVVPQPRRGRAIPAQRTASASERHITAKAI